MTIEGIKHIKDHQLKVWLSDGTIKSIDLREFIFSSTHPLINKYRNVELFKMVYLDSGVPSWGDNEFDINPQSIINGDFNVE